MSHRNVVDPERHRRLRSAFEVAVETDPADRPAVVAELSTGDESFRRDLEALLVAHQGGSLDDRPAAGAVRDLLGTLGPEDDPDPLIDPGASSPRQVGPYRLVERVAVGGMGAVYRGERVDGGFDQTVAIKVLALGTESDTLLQRFESERRILAALEHPNIARLVDGGTTPDGLPYLVMEYVDGRPIDRYCDERRLSLEARIDLFLDVCEAVQAAHRALIVHRDLKPSNILVSDDGTPKLLDFGIAKPFDPEWTSDARSVTRTSIRPMTPAYASPEQVRGDPVTTASDVYSLGVVLYEILVGRRPYGPSATPTGLERAILETSPERPSSATDVDAASRFGSTPERLRRRLRGDLDNIVLKALRKEPDRRYDSVAALAADLRRHRTGHPVSARPDTRLYRARKFIRRNAMGVAAAALVAAALVGGIGATLRQARAANAARESAEATAGFIEDVLGMAGAGWMTSGERAGPDVTVAEAVDRAAEEVGDRLGHMPDVEARIRRTLAMTYSYLGRYEDARAQAALALERDRQVFPERTAAIGRDLALLADAQYLLGRYDEAEPHYRQAVDILDATLDQPDSLHVHTVNNLGLLLLRRGDPEAAEPVLQRALAMNRAWYGQEHPVVAIVLSNLAGVCEARGDLTCAERRYRESMDVWGRIGGRERMERAGALGGLGRVLSLDGRPDAATYLTQALDLFRRTLGPDHEFVGGTLMTLALHHLRVGQVDSAGREMRQAMEIATTRLPAQHPGRSIAGVAFARVLLAEGNAEDAEARARDGLAVLENVFGPADPRTANARVVLGAALIELGRAPEAVPLLRKAEADLASALGTDHPATREPRRLLSAIQDAAQGPAGARGTGG